MSCRQIILSGTRKNVLDVKQYTYFTVFPQEKSPSDAYGVECTEWQVGPTNERANERRLGIFRVLTGPGRCDWRSDAEIPETHVGHLRPNHAVHIEKRMLYTRINAFQKRDYTI